MARFPKNTPEQCAEFCRRLDAYFTGERRAIATRDLERYFESDDEPFTGRWFEAAKRPRLA